ncbi:protease HtpX [Candidatus Gracilibacteria bacterium 28_42_T64]|nr:protease HtpX [Candidatus Gracilibacteria bacterium 28_42_T64]
MFKRVGLFLLTNIAVMVLLSIVVFILERFFGISLSGNGYIFVVAIVIGFGGAFISLALSKWMAKRAYNIVLITSDNISSLDKKERIVWDVVSDLADRNHIKMPEVGIYKDMDPNAFATGATKNSSLVAVSTGLLESMDEAAIEGVVAHEMAHILNGDMVTMTLLQGVLNTFVIFFARVVANIISNFLDEELSWLAYYGVVILLEIIFGIFASIIVMAFSRHREFKADEGSAKFVGKEKMIAGLQALKKMQHLAGGEKSKLASMKISTKKKGGIMALFSSHPDLDDRIKKLEELSI